MLRCLAFLGLVFSCGTTNTTPPPTLPQVFLTVAETNVIGSSVRGTVSVNGCSDVSQVQLLLGDDFLSDANYTGNPTAFTLTQSSFTGLYARLGFAADLSLKAKVLCADGRTNTSVTAGVKFFPVASRTAPPAGQLMVPNNFVVEGGLGGSAVTFLGCALTERGGTKLTRIDTMGVEKAFNEALPFDCTLDTQISEKSSVTGTRWVLEPLQGAYAIDGNLEIRRVFRHLKTRRMGVGARGSVALWIDEGGTRNRIEKIDPVPTPTANEWSTFTSVPTGALVGIVNSNPVIDDGAGSAVWVTDWRFDIGTRRADIVPLKLDLNTGALLNGVINGQPAVLLSQQYPVSELSEPIMPEGVFNADGTVFTLPLLSYDASNTIRTTVLACATAFGNCEGTSRRWTSPTFNGVIRLVVPYSASGIVAAVGPYQVYFLAGQSGEVFNQKPLRPSGTQVVVGVQPGAGTDFYVLTGPNFGNGVPSFPTEIIATDHPMTGELWRLGYGSGTSSADSMYIGVDESQQVWVRAGADLVKPFANSVYREALKP